MLLRNLEIVGERGAADIGIEDGRISSVGTYAEDAAGCTISFENAMAFPGLINSHDHLDFNLFPQLGGKLHNNYVEWATYIHAHYKETINNVLKIPMDDRVRWGIYKNLISGITTVVNHGTELQTDNKLITVFQQYHLLHSVQLEKYWKYLLNKPFKRKWPFVIHTGEGGDIESHNEIDRLRKWNLYKRDIIGVHGIAMNEPQAAFFKALVWCPASNFFLIGKTALVERLKHMTDMLFGTDSTLSAGWNIWDHLRVARSLKMVSDEELYNMLTITPAEIWNLNGCGKIGQNFEADIVVARKKDGLTGFDAFFSLNPEDILLVVHKGNIRLFDATLHSQLIGCENIAGQFSTISVNGINKYIYGDLPGLMNGIKNHYPGVSFPIEFTEH